MNAFPRFTFALAALMFVAVFAAQQAYAAYDPSQVNAVTSSGTCTGSNGTVLNGYTWDLANPFLSDSFPGGFFDTPTHYCTEDDEITINGATKIAGFPASQWAVYGIDTVSEIMSYVYSGPATVTPSSSLLKRTSMATTYTVPGGPAGGSSGPSASLIALPPSITKNLTTSALTWSCGNSVSASIDGLGTVSPTAGGTVQVAPDTTTAYHLTCTGSNPASVSVPNQSITLDCSSLGYAYASCPLGAAIDHVVSIAVVQQYSYCHYMAPYDCQPFEGINYGVTGNSLWVDKGYRARFMVTYAPAGSAGSSASPTSISIPNGGTWSPYEQVQEQDFDLAAGEYFSGLGFRSNCDNYSSENACVSMKTDTAAPSSPAYQADGGTWSDFEHDFTWELPAGQYFSGFKIRPDCDNYSSDDSCIAVKIATAAAGDPAYRTNAGGTWSGYQHTFAWDLAPDQYISGIAYHTNCDNYSSADGCISLKISSLPVAPAAPTPPPTATDDATVTVVAAGPQCSDGVDNDGNGLVDCGDPACHSDGDAANAASCVPTDPESPGAPPGCSDGADNNGNHLADRADPACHTDGNPGNPSTYDPNLSETGGPGWKPECSDGIDNDHNGFTDWHADPSISDPGCTGPNDTDESTPPPSMSMTVSDRVRPQTSATITWSAANVKSGLCVLTGNNGDSWNLVGLLGTQITSALAHEVTYTLRCIDLGGHATSTSQIVHIAPSSGEE